MKHREPLWPAVMLALVMSSNQFAQTLVDLRSQSKSVDFSAAPSTKPFAQGTSLPSVCSVGQTFFKTDASPGKNLYLCTSANIWSPVAADQASTASAAIQPGTSGGILVTDTGSAILLDADPSFLATQSGNNTFTGNSDFSGAAFLRIVAGTGAPVTGCNGLADVGKLYARSDAQTAKATYYGCAQTGTGAYSWELIGDGGGAGSGYATIQNEGTSQTQRNMLNFTGGGVTCIDNASQARTDCTIPGGSFDPSDTTKIWGVDNLVGTYSGTSILKNTFPIGELGFRTNVIGSGDCSGSKTNENGHVGILVISHTGTAAGDGCVIHQAQGTQPPFPPLDASGAFTSWKVQYIVKTPADVSAVALYAGLFYGVSGYQTDRGISIRYDSTAQTCTTGTNSTGNWVYDTYANPNRTCVDSGVPVTANTWYKFEISSTTSGTVTFKINGSNVGSISTDLPTQALGPVIGLRSRTTTPNSFYLDRYAYEMVY